MNKNKHNILIIVQARMGSQRLPGKTLRKILNKTLLSYQLERLKRVVNAQAVIVATSTAAQDDLIEAASRSEGVKVYRGSENDVLDRYYQAAKTFNGDIIIRICGDCPLIDPVVIDKVINFYLTHSYDYVANTLARTYPRGMDVEIFSFDLLKRAAKEAGLPEEREHVTPYFYEHPDLFSLGNVSNDSDQSSHRWTVDTEEDFQLIKHIIESLWPVKPYFNMDDVLQVISLHPEWTALNAHIRQKPLR